MDDASNPNTKLIAARRRLQSPTGSGHPMSRQELAEAVNAWQWSRYQREDRLDETDVGKLERGETHWPGLTRREGFRAVLRATTDAELGFYRNRRSRSPTAAGTVALAPLLPSLLTSSSIAARGPESRQPEQQALLSAAGRFFDGESVDARIYPAVEDGRVLATVPADFAGNRFLTRARRGLVVGAVTDDERVIGYGLDTRQARRRLAKAEPGSRLLIPPAYVLDDITVGILWAVVNLDEPLLNDDALLADLQQQLGPYESLPTSSLGRDPASELAAVSQMWLGSYFCAHHILRHLNGIADIPQFWTREQRGEEASTWLLFRHKYDYLRAITDRFTGQPLTRALCIPSASVTASPPGERILLLLTAALMESFNIRVNVSADPEYAAVEGFVLDNDRQAIVANWIGAEGIWQVGVTTDRPAIRDYGDLSSHTSAHSVVAGTSASRRLQAMADYLELDWSWLVTRCARLGDYGCAGFAQPRSRLLSIVGVDRACRYLGQAGTANH
ncbi:XRE family transcriptional regulator [Jidongwangia harbinensis]|uniref:XRE family transcriptional regulator n=1 Tax=Jidongwangia harbinensis TaxID=2878561 RepID=UPI001CD93E1B|nr:XRE family transcriptional regulator [Jidongwangia harbinensis]MCA2216293.1 XRE family transcriptional regulator [Jidongwangia harbinensis]MCA2217028.1 XRE family transcriptional regulator [Jidongwangia harbinensis]